MTPTVADLLAIVPELLLAAAALGLLLVARRIREGHAAAVITVLVATVAALLVGQSLGSESAPTFGAMLTLDGYAQFFRMLFLATLILATLLSSDRGAEDHGPGAEYHVLLLLAAVGMMLAGASADLIPLYLSLELITICAYILVGLRVDHPAANEAAIKYLLLGSFASALLLFGISLVYGLTGTTRHVDVARALAERGSVDPLLLVAIALVAAGLAFKIAAVPFHSWAPDAYQGASAPVAGFLAAGSKAAGLAALGRVFLVAFGAQGDFVGALVVGLAALSMLFGSVVALAQTDTKRMLAYSSIAHAGYAVLGLIVGTSAGVSATMTYAFFYVFMTLGAFGVVIALGARGETLQGFAGLSAQRPGTAALMLLFLLSLTGIPPTAGFAAKFAVISSAVAADQIPLAVLAVLCSVITAFVYMRVAVLMYMGEAPAARPQRLPAAVAVALAVAALVTLVGGIFPGAVVAWAVAP